MQTITKCYTYFVILQTRSLDLKIWFQDDSKLIKTKIIIIRYDTYYTQKEATQQNLQV
jgi:hypothetical protein